MTFVVSCEPLLLHGVWACCGLLFMVWGCQKIFDMPWLRIGEALSSASSLDNTYIEIGLCLIGSLIFLLSSNVTTKRMRPQTKAVPLRFQKHGFNDNRIKTDVLCDAESFHAVIRGSLRAKDHARAQQWLSKMIESEVKPNTHTFNVFIESHMSAGDVAGMESCLGQMHASGLSPNKFTYDMMIQMHASDVDGSQMEKYAEQMMQEGFLPGSKSYNAIISHYVQAANMDAALRWAVALKSCTKSKINCCGEIVSLWAKKGSCRESEGWLEKMLLAGIRPSREACTSVIGACAKSGDLVRADRLYNSLSGQGVYPKAHAITAVICACAKSGNTSMGKMWIERIDSTDLLDPSVYRQALSAYAKMGDVAGASAYMTKMEARGVIPDFFAHNSMLHACVKANDLESMSHWLQVMDGRNIQCDTIACNTVMNAYAAVGDTDRVMRIFDRMQGEGMSPDDVSYAIAAKACAVKGDVLKVKKLMNEMLAQGLKMRDHHLCAMLLAHTNGQPWQPDKAEATFRFGVAAGAEVTRPVVIGLARAVGWSRCNQIVGSRDRRRIISQPW